MLEIVGLSFGVVELLAVAGATTLGVYVYGPGGRERVEAFSTSVASSLSNLTEEFGALFVKKADNRFIDYIAGKYGLTRAERRALHDLMTKQGLTPEEIEAEAVELVRSRHQHEQPDARESGNGGGNSGEQE